MSEPVVVYSSVGGTTRKVAQRIAQRLGCAKPVDTEAAPGRLSSPSAPPSLLVLCCPAYGDSELETRFERFLVGFDWVELRGVPFAFCELGIYTGYEDFGHGLAAIVYDVLCRNGLVPVIEPISLDSVPVTDWAALDEWIDLLSRHLDAADG